MQKRKERTQFTVIESQISAINQSIDRIRAHKLRTRRLSTKPPKKVKERLMVIKLISSKGIELSKSMGKSD